MAGVLHDCLSNQRYVLDIAHAAHRSGAARRAVHAASVEFDYAFLIGQATQADGVVLGIVFGTFDDLQSGIQGVATIFQKDVGTIEVSISVVGANDDWTLPCPGSTFWLGRRLLAPVLTLHSERRRTEDCGGDKIAARKSHASLLGKALRAKQNSMRIFSPGCAGDD